MEHVTIQMGEKCSISQSNEMERSTTGSNTSFKRNQDEKPGTVLWIDGLICAFEFVEGHIGSISSTSAPNTLSRKVEETHAVNGSIEDSSQRMDSNKLLEPSSLSKLSYSVNIPCQDGRWVPIGWDRISELVQILQTAADWPMSQIESMVGKDRPSVEDLAPPFHEQPAGPTWWCHVDAKHPLVLAWLKEATWLHPAISSALRDESQLISERTKHLLYELPTRVAGGLLFELFGYSTGESLNVPIVLRSWQAQNFLLTAQHLRVTRANIFSIKEVEELLSLGGYNAPRTITEVVAQLVHCLARWDDRLFRKCISEAADELELKFMSRRNQENMNVFSIIMNRETKMLSQQVTRMGWALRKREEIVFELVKHFRVNSAARTLLKETRKCTTEMMNERETIRARLFTIQDLLQNTVRAWLQDGSLRVTHNLAVFGGSGVILSVVTGIFGVNFDGIPGTKNAPYAFGLFVAILFLTGAVLSAVGLLCLGFRGTVTEQQVEDRQTELDKEIEKQRELKKIQMNAQVIRAAYLFEKAVKNL